MTGAFFEELDGARHGRERVGGVEARVFFVKDVLAVFWFKGGCELGFFYLGGGTATFEGQAVGASFHHDLVLRVLAELYLAREGRGFGLCYRSGVANVVGC